MKEVYDFLENNIDFSLKPNIVVAVSGGPDSMVLLNVLMDMRSKYIFKIICAHVNHNVRKESEEEKIFLEQYCLKNNIIFEYMKILEYNNNNFHNQARNIRYEFFDNVVKKYNSNYLLTAHHGDDLIETVLMRITRGSNLKGYSGFSIVSKKDGYKILRPLVFLTKDEIKEYAIKNNIPFVVDKSNEKDCYTRNRYRKYILPFLKKEDKNIHKKYLEFNNELLRYENYINKEVENIYSNIIKNNEIIISKFNSLDILLKEKLIERFLANIYMNSLYLIKKKHVQNIIDLCNSSKSNSSISLPHDIIIIKEYDILKVNKVKNKFKPLYKELNDKLILENNKIIEIVKNSDDTSNYCIRLNSEEINLPLYIRTKKQGDKISVKGLNGTQKVKDIFINSKIPKSKREKYPLLVDANSKILWIPGIKKSKYDKSKQEKYDIIVRYKLKKEEKHEEK